MPSACVVYVSLSKKYDRIMSAVLKSSFEKKSAVLLWFSACLSCLPCFIHFCRQCMTWVRDKACGLKKNTWVPRQRQDDCMQEWKETESQSSEYYSLCQRSASEKATTWEITAVRLLRGTTVWLKMHDWFQQDIQGAFIGFCGYQHMYVCLHAHR